MRITLPALLLASAAFSLPAFAQSTEQATEPMPQTAPTETEATDVPADPSVSTEGTTATPPAATTADTLTTAPATTVAPTFPAPEGYSSVEFGTVTADELKGVDLYDPTDSSVAEVADIVLGSDGKVTGIVTDVGGFLGIGEHRISLAPEEVTFFRNADGDLRAYVGLTKEQLKALPAYVAPVQ